MAQLGAQCPQLVRLFGICFEEPYRLVMELLTRGGLYSLLRNDRALDWTLKSNIARDVAIGLEFLHDRNVIHRDIKSFNILLSGDFSAKLSDYGLAKIKENSTSSTSVVQAVGTLPWMAPELIAGDEPLYSICRPSALNNQNNHSMDHLPFSTTTSPR
jgi:serine/threonine protein kinase